MNLFFSIQGTLVSFWTVLERRILINSLLFRLVDEVIRLWYTTT